MDKFTVDKLHLTPRSDDELHSVLSNFELKWQNKVRHVRPDDDSVSRF